jgi:hypothetical protein
VGADVTVVGSDDEPAVLGATCQDLQELERNNHFYILKQVQMNIHWTVRNMQCLWRYNIDLR